MKEQSLTRLNQCKLIEKWRNVLRDAKSQELIRELEVSLSIGKFDYLVISSYYLSVSLDSSNLIFKMYLQMMKIDFDKRYKENILEINRLQDSLIQSGLDFVSICKEQKSETDKTISMYVICNFFCFYYTICCTNLSSYLHFFI